MQLEVVGGGPVFDFEDLYPGASTTSTVRVTNLRGEPGSLTLSAVDIVDESKCSPVETKSAAHCGSGIGALGAQVVLTIERLLPGGGATPVWTGDIYSLTGIDIASVLPGGAVWEYRFTAHLPSASGNETQADELGFKLRFNLAGETGGGGGTTGGDPPGSDTGGTDTPTDGGTDGTDDGGTDDGGTDGTDGSSGGSGGGGETTAGGTDGTEVLGSVVTRPGAGGAQVFGLSLPRTGAEIARALVMATAALLAGGMMLATTAQLRRHPRNS
ncbi:MAG TPA: hypothetical protein VIR30_09410 [Nocardioides sp.]